MRRIENCQRANFQSPNHALMLMFYLFVIMVQLIIRMADFQLLNKQLFLSNAFALVFLANKKQNSDLLPFHIAISIK